MMDNPMMNQNMNMGQGYMINNQMNQMNNMNGMMMNMINFNNKNMPMNQFATMMGNMNAQIANNNFCNQGNFQNNNAQNQNDYGGINVSDEIIIQYLPDEKVSELIKRYRTKTGDDDTTKKFIFNAKALNESLSVAEAGLANNLNVFVVRTKGIKGAK